MSNEKKKRCPACGEEILAIAKKCKHCGEILDEDLAREKSSRRAHDAGTLTAPTTSVPGGRSESVVLQVAPAIENDMIADMEGFGWELHGRQEVEQQGNTTGEIRTNVWGQVVARSTTKITRFVKLHFTRRTDLPHHEQLQKLEAEYRGLPAGDDSWGCTGCLFFWGLLVTGLGIYDPKLRREAIVFAIVGVVPLIVGLAVILRRGAAARQIREQSLARAAEIRAQVANLLG